MKRVRYRTKLTYDVTKMQNGHFRSECHLSGCGWWSDVVDFEYAKAMLRDHMKTHGITGVSIVPEKEL